MEQNNDIRANVAAIREKMAEAARSCGRDPKEIKLCAATKMNDAARVKEAVAAGVDCCGENRVQELLEKQPQGAYEGAPVHFIGHLQTNKVKQVVGRVDLIESSTGRSCWSVWKSRRRSWTSCRTSCWRSISVRRRANPALHPKKPCRQRQKWQNIPTAISKD